MSSLFGESRHTGAEAPIPPNFPRSEAARIVALPSRAEREAALRSVRPAFAATVEHFCILAWALELAEVPDRPAAQAVIARLPVALEPAVRALARSWRTAARAAS